MKAYIKIHKKIINLLQKADLKKKVENYKLIFFLKPYTKIDKSNIKFHDTEIEQCKFYQHGGSFLIDNIDINKTIVSIKVSFGKKDFKYFIHYKDKDAKKITPLCIFLANLGAYRRDFDKTEIMSFLIKDEKLLEKYNEFCKKVSNIIKKEFGSKSIYNEKYLKTKIKSIMEKSAQIFAIIKHQKKVLNIFVYQ